MCQEKEALKKLANVKKDHEKRLDSLQKAQVRLNKELDYGVVFSLEHTDINYRYISV